MGYTDMTTRFVYKNPVVWGDLDALAENDKWAKDNGWQDSTQAVFYQAAAPTGWTKATSQNDKLLRVVSGAGGGAGGTKAPSTAFSVAHANHSIADSGAHTHNADHQHILDNGASNASSPGSQLSPVVKGVTDYLYSLFSSGGASNFTALKNTLTARPTITTGAGGNHNHGTVVTGSALTDFTLAYCDVIVCSKDTSSGYTDETTQFNHNDKIDFDPFDPLADNDAFSYARLMPTGSVLIWNQATAPVGWTKQTSVNAKALRVVSGTGGGTGGGSQDIGANIALTHSHTTPADGTHSHSIAAHICDFDTTFAFHSASTPGADDCIQADGGGILQISGLSGPAASHTCYKAYTANDGSGNTDNNFGGNHTHTVGTYGSNVAIAYVDQIQCSKDSGGAPYAYANLHSSTAWKKLVSKQRLNNYGKNDAHIYFHTPPSGSNTIFFQSAAPLSWTKSTAQNDKALRMVSGGTGGSSGGSLVLSSAVPLAHTHTLNSVVHSHAIGSHTHALDSGSLSSNTIFSNNGFGDLTSGTFREYGNAGSGNSLKNVLAATAGVTDTLSHNHGGATGSYLTDVVLAYIDVIACTKD